MTRTIETTLGELIRFFFEQFLSEYGDEEIASVATAAIISDILASEPEPFEDAA